VSYFVHLCGRKQNSNIDAQFCTLESILKSQKLLTNNCPIFWVQQVWLRLNDPRLVLNNKKHRLAGVGLTDDLPRLDVQREFSMACLSLIDHKDILAHAQVFGYFGIAFKRDQVLGSKAEKVKYVDPDVKDNLPHPDSPEWRLLQDNRNDSQSEWRLFPEQGLNHVPFIQQDIAFIVIPTTDWGPRIRQLFSSLKQKWSDPIKVYAFETDDWLEISF